MKLLTEVYGKSDAFDMKVRLEAKGIPVYIGGDSSGPAVGMIYGSDIYTLWVENDSQLACAAHALQDEDYMPVHPIDIDDYRSQQEAHVNLMKQGIGRFYDRVLNFVVIAVLAAATYYAYSNVIM